jgi:hypothetical protein
LGALANRKQQFSRLFLAVKTTTYFREFSLIPLEACATVLMAQKI